MSYLSTLPRRLVNLPLSIIMLVLLFPFYWMAIAAVKPKEHLLDLNAARTRENVRQQFIQTPEFQARVQAIIAAGCKP